jgi:hypothetical protein
MTVDFCYRLFTTSSEKVFGDTKGENEIQHLGTTRLTKLLSKAGKDQQRGNDVNPGVVDRLCHYFAHFLNSQNRAPQIFRTLLDYATFAFRLQYFFSGYLKLAK